MKNSFLLIVLIASIALAALGAFLKILTKGVSGNEIMIAAICIKAVVLTVLVWKNRNTIIPWLKQ